ncbi:unnamed protein product, partial [marine sediment metagenome]
MATNIQKIIFEDIQVKHPDYTFGRGKYGEFKVVIMKETGYINASKLCKLGGKDYRMWKRYGKSQALINAIKDDVGKNVTISINGAYAPDIRGTYVHSYLVPHIACSISVDFAVKVSKWLDEWRSYSIKNELNYWTSLGKAMQNPTNYNNDKEKQIQDRLRLELENAEIEVE